MDKQVSKVGTAELMKEHDVTEDIEVKRKVLVIEDNELNRDLLTELLSDKYDVLIAENGKIGLEMLQDNYQRLSVVLLDVHMPVMDGFEFLERVHDDAKLSSIPVIVTTASNETEAEIRCLGLGAVDYIVKPYNSRAVLGRINSVIKLRESVSTLAAVEYDDFTGLYTRQAFCHHAKELMQYRPQCRFLLVVTEIVDFKLINSVYGVKAGEDILKSLTNIFNGFLETGLCSRCGNDQFACIIYGNQPFHHRDIEENAKKILEELAIPNLRIKYGVYEDVDKLLAVDEMLDRGFMAVDSIKDDYDTDVAYYTEEMNNRLIRNRQIENWFDEAIENEEFKIYYQPKVNVTTEKTAGAEALVRWIRGDGTFMSPGEFIPVYEKDGLIVKLDEYVFRHVCEFQKRQMNNGKALLPISINLSRASIHRKGIVESYIEIVNQLGIPVSCVPIELTETAALYSRQIKDFTDKLVNAGFELHMDDFGSGYSSLTSLNELPFSVLKIDKSLIDYVEQKKGRTVVEQAIMLGKLLNMKIIAEGVERKEQVEILRELKADEIQGFYYAKPMKESEFLNYTK